MSNAKGNRKLLGALASIGSGVCWGFSGSMGQYLFREQGMSSEWLVPIRLFFAGVIMLVFCFFHYGAKRTIEPFRNRRDSALFFVYGIPGVALCQFLYFLCIQHSSANVATILQDLAPSLILVFSCILYRRKPRALEIGAILLAFLGVLAIVTHGNLGSLSISTIALAAGIGSAIGIAINNLVGKSLVNRFPVPIMQGWAFFWGGLCLAIFFRSWQIPYTPNLMGYIGIAFVVLIGNVAAFSFYMTAVDWIGPVPAGLYAFSEPITAALVTGFFFHTPFSLWDALGFFLILVMMVMISYQTKRE